jgi:CRP-like cAMP-binding protein
MQISPILQNLSVDNFETLCSHATKRHYAGDEVIFEEGDSASEFFFVKSGRVSIYIHKYHRSEDISSIHEGDCFGEMAILSNTRRTASAKALQDSTLLCLDMQAFRSVLKKYPDIEEKISSLVAKRNEELVLKESILDSSGLNEDHLHLSIKGDPSMRETVFNRERYESIVDKILPELIPRIESMLLERNVFRINLNFNSGEIEIYTIFNPFTPETHAANRLTSSSYLDRHFPLIAYDVKAQIIKKVHMALAEAPYLTELPSHWQHLFLDPLKTWEPVPAKKIQHALSQLTTLRSLENYYLRNFGISTILDVIRMQFNCDGTHIVSNEDYQRFLQENL